MTRVMVRYKVKPEQVARNEELVRAVYEELASHRARTGCATRRSSCPTASRSSTSPTPTARAARSPGLAAFKAFQAGLRERCDEPPVRQRAERGGVFAW